jgi:hypothetical protein
MSAAFANPEAVSRLRTPPNTENSIYANTITHPLHYAYTVRAKLAGARSQERAFLFFNDLLLPQLRRASLTI